MDAHTRAQPFPIAALAVTAVLTTAPGAGAQTSLPPDLVVLTSYFSGWSISGTTTRVLSFSAGYGNGGQGQLHFRGTTNIISNPDGTLSQEVIQRISRSDGTSFDRSTGFHTYHPTHSHVHFDGWATHRLRIRPLDMSIGPAVVERETSSFCIIDIVRYNPALPGSPPSSVFSSCGTTTQGLSVGWADVLSAGLETQQLDVTGIPNGNYWLESQVDSRNNLLELDDTNNIGRIAITISSQPPVGLRILSSSPVGTVAGPVGSIDVRFNQVINPSTFTGTDVVINGPGGLVGPTSVASIDGNLAFRLTFPTQTAAGTYTVAIGPGIANPSGALMDQDNDGIPGELTDRYNSAFMLTPPPCPADFDHDGAVNSTDFFAFLDAFFDGLLSADFNGSGAVDSTDFFGYLAAFFAGC